METMDEVNSNVEKGLIIRVYMENFVTYDKAVFIPGRNLNLIIGPNGTGKSTIVCAIVLGLAGKPKVIGRAEKIADYVKAGCQEAKIEIELFESENKTLLITRKFTSHNTTTWFINGKQVPIKEILAITKQLNIQVDNLCQFLPQDKVQSFSEMDSKTLLLETERSVGDPLLLERHEQLIEYRKQLKEIEVEVANKSRSLENKIQRYDGLKDIVGSIKEKKTIKNKITSLNQKKMWMLYDQLRQQFQDSKKQRDAAAVQMKELDEQLKPMNGKIDKIKARINVIQNSVRDKTSQFSARMAKVNRANEEIQSCEDNIKDIEDTRDRKIEQEQACDQTISGLQQQKSKLDNDLRSILQEFGSEEALAEQQVQALHLVDKQRKIIDSLSKNMTTLKYKDDQFNRDLRNLDRELQMARAVDAQRLELLRQRNPDAYKGVLWLRENKHIFSAPVHEPMFLNINVKDPKYSKYLESTISYNDMIAFVCENSEDMNLLVNSLRGQQKLVVNVVHSDPNRNVRMNPNIPIEEIGHFGFEHYLISLVEAPQTIMKYIVQNFHLANIPVGSDIVEENVDRIPDSLSYFFSKSNNFSVNRSKYSGEKSVRQNTVSGNGMLSITMDTAKLNGIHNRINQLKQDKEEVAEEIREFETQISHANGQLIEYRNIRTNYQQKIGQIETLRSKIRMAGENIRKLQENRISIEEIQAMYKSEIQDMIKTQISLYEKLNTILEDCFVFEKVNGQSKLELKIEQQKLRQYQNDSQELRDKCDNAERIFKNLEEELRPLKNEVENLYKQALESTNKINPQDKRFQKFNTVFEKLPNSIEEIDEELRTAQAKVFCMGKNDDSENILKEFERITKEVEELKKYVENKTKELQTLTTETENLRNQWLPILEQLVDRINDNFSRYFSEMKCAGEISLTHEENIMDFDKYGLKIRVKFRDVDQLQELTRTHQSGGERAVTTAVYMISLQELSTVPFRCVDEINQGMDAINERRIFELIVNITGKSNSSQYFLLTPKLLPNLKYSDTVTVHCVYNGQFMVSHEEFSVTEFCRSRQRN
ncbi:structural maintenance of chromosomes protein 5 [Leptopilina boulardi]|uniref:structural maintenance of chromosomes protein 5 n=1 Tax=Leptopilina boulardi TaxID=63433 RepID=UPI0021F52BB7|nr:structural maintenance of chromosomes protein 5 [Leptopilina boulardi]